MILARGPLRAVNTAAVSFTEDGEPFAEHYGDSYFSRENGIEESRHVFLEGSHLEQRLRRLNRPFTVGELGFGTGLNFLLTWQVLRASGNVNDRLHFWTVDAHPLSAPDLRRAHDRWPAVQREAMELQAAYPPPVPGVHRRIFDKGRVILDMVWAEASEAVADLASLHRPLVDAWYLDGFAPSRNAAMWTEELFRGIASASRDNATVATFTVAGGVRRGLQGAGFEVEKRPGYGRKRECLSGRLGRRPTIRPPSTPWDLPANASARPPTSVTIIGAGLAGASLAAALAKRGCQVSVLEAERVAARASGNPQGVLFNRLSPQRSALADFSLHANLFAAAGYEQLFQEHALRRGIDGDLNGCLQVGSQAQRVTAEQMADLPELGTLLDAQSTTEKLGSASPGAGLWQPASGWLSPPAVCKALLDHPTISLREGCGPLNVVRDGDRWSITGKDGAECATAEILLVAAGEGSRMLYGSAGLPLKTVRGQTTQIPAPAHAPLGVSFCHDGYITPARHGEHCIGSTFQPNDEDRRIRTADHRQNLEKLAAALPAWGPYLESLDPEHLEGRAELRCVSPDYLPVVGQLPREESFRDVYKALAYDASLCIDDQASYEEGLYVSTGHGSRGLSYTALGAELVASQLFGEPLPVSREFQRALSPARFLLRSIIRGTANSFAFIAITLVLALAGTDTRAQDFEGTSPAPSPKAPAPPIWSYSYEVIERLPMSRDNFVQGLQIVGDTLYMGTGQYGESRLREYDFETMELRRQVELPEDLFGEGVVRLDNQIFQLTWLSGKLLVYDATTLALQKTAAITTQGWGITHDGQQLIYSDGSHRLRIIDPETLEATGHIDVTLQGQRLARLNELEWIDGEIWANVWMANQLVRIDPASGAVTGIVDLRGLLGPEDRREDTDVLNGIAWDAEERALWVTGKRWPWLYRIRPVRLPGP